MNRTLGRVIRIPQVPIRVIDYSPESLGVGDEDIRNTSGHYLPAPISGTFRFYGAAVVHRDLPLEDIRFTSSACTTWAGSVRLTIEAALNEIKVQELANTWKCETGHFSIVQHSISHPAYLQIVGMSDKALPFLMKQVEQGSAQWLPALRAIAGDTKPDEGNTLADALNAWTQWWEAKQAANTYARMDFSR